MKKVLSISVLFLACILFVGGAYAQAKPKLLNCGAKDQKLEGEQLQSTVTTIQDAYQKIKSFGANFTQLAYLSALGTNEKSDGKVYFLSPGNLRFDYKSPEPQVFVLSGEKVSFYQEMDEQMIVDKVSKVLISELPLAFLAGVGDLRDSFSVVSGCQRADDIVVEFRPKSKKDDNLKGFKLRVDGKTYRPLAAYVIDMSGNSNLIEFNKIDYTAQINKELFNFVPPTGTDIITR